jgi:hypothetical protein
MSHPRPGPRTWARPTRIRSPGDGVPDMITGIAAAAEYPGYGEPDSFRRARTRNPIPGETRTPDGRPAWTRRRCRLGGRRCRRVPPLDRGG